MDPWGYPKRPSPHSSAKPPASTQPVKRTEDPRQVVSQYSATFRMVTSNDTVLWYATLSFEDGWTIRSVTSPNGHQTKEAAREDAMLCALRGLRSYG
ncbi:hypothetical protein M408DRAFT_328487 [Serendipita vermifera MAFF 305830]|uniref:DRBM domain-containing protein n=1 Tax=Serendipita vermifera MAFF 305830 TaxID=933852 RepID=A0A0C3BDB1_SERVB|nr:hypothetical protein M408DRAFT_328487 [Serendipita vermifera MAFF 305830]